VTRSVLLSVKPKFARSLMAGTKTAEVRRRFPDIAAGTLIYVYSSSPERAIVGTLRSEGVHRRGPNEVWEQFKEIIDIDERYLHDYLVNVDEAVVVEVSAPQPWNVPVSLAQLRELLGVEPPQSYRYLTEEQGSLLESGGGPNGILGSR
jgi:predicted transcriptional regulator